MREYKYVRLGVQGESHEVGTERFHNSEHRYDLPRLLAAGWRPVREVLMPYEHTKGGGEWTSYPYVLVLLERETGTP